MREAKAMVPSSMIYDLKRRLLTALALGLLIGPVTEAMADAPALVRIEVHFNFLTGTSSWISSGAFADTGTIGLDETNPRFVGSPHPDQVGIEKVIGPIVASDGSKIYWKFNKVFFPTDDPTLYVTKAQWHIVDATGRYVGLRGQGDLDGTLNFQTNELVDVFTGWVHLPSP